MEDDYEKMTPEEVKALFAEWREDYAARERESVVQRILGKPAEASRPKERSEELER